MLTIAVLLDGHLLARVRSDDVDVLSVSLGGSKVDDAVASVEFSGGRYPQDGPSVYLTWLSDLQVSPGQTIRVEVGDAGETLSPGKTLQELFPDGHEEQAGPAPGRQQVIEDLRARPHRRERVRLSLRSSSGDQLDVATAPQEHGFGGSVLWNWTRPERASVSLYTYTLDQLLADGGFDDHFREYLDPGSWVEVRVDG